MKRMKSLMTITLAIGLCLVCRPAIAAEEEGKMSVEERAKVVKLLKESEAETLRALETLSDEQLHFKPAPERWSVLEVAEHIYLAEGLLFGAMERALAAPSNSNWADKTKGKTQLLEDVLAGRKGKASAPESIVPSAKMTRQDLLAKFKEARAKTLAFTESTQADVKTHTLDHPFPIFGTLNAYQWLIYIPFHNIRHNKQIEEVKASPGFPKK